MVKTMKTQFQHTDRFYILDCLGNIRGNPNGYKTFRGANQALNSRMHGRHSLSGRYSLSSRLWSEFNSLKDHGKIPKTATLVHEIVYNELKAD